MVLCWQPNLVTRKSLRRFWLKGLKGSWKAAEVRHCVAGMEFLKRPGEAIGEGAASVAAEGPVLKGAWRKVEAWHHVAG